MNTNVDFEEHTVDKEKRQKKTDGSQFYRLPGRSHGIQHDDAPEGILRHGEPVLKKASGVYGGRAFGWQLWAGL